MRVIFVNRFYWPETPATGQLLTDLAEGLVERGWEVTVITSGTTELPAEATREGVHIQRVAAAARNRGSLIAKARDFLGFHVGAAARLWRSVGHDSVVVCLSDPPLLGVTCALITRLRGAQLVHWVHDIYPELAIVLTGQRWARILLPLRNAAWRMAEACITLGDDMAGHIRAMGIPGSRVVVIPNWAPRGVTHADADAVRAQRMTWGVSDRCVVMYAGNLGRVHDLDPILEVASRVSDDPTLCFVIVGDGPRKAALQTAAQKRGLTNVKFLPPQPRSALAAVLGAGDIHLVTLLPACASLVFPSKLYGAAAIGRPILFLGPKDAEPARVVRQSGCGVAFTPEPPARIAAALRCLANDRNRRRDFGMAARRLAATGTDASIAAWHTQLAAICNRG